MFERLDKLRADVEHCRKRVEQSRMKLKEAEDKLKEAEKMQILSDVKSMNLSPEQLNALLSLVSKNNADAVIDNRDVILPPGNVILSGAKDLEGMPGDNETPDNNEEDNEDE